MNDDSIAVTSPIAVSRSAPAHVLPVTLDGIRYAPTYGQLDGEHEQVGGLLAAFDADGKVLWSMKVYENRRRDDLEGDVQDVFFRSMDLQPDGRLLIVNEAGQRFLVDVKARTSVPLPVEEIDDDDGIRP